MKTAKRFLAFMISMLMLMLSTVTAFGAETEGIPAELAGEAEVVSFNEEGEEPSYFSPAASSVAMYRLYNPNSGEHFYTASTGERDNLKKVGWQYEGIGWYAPQTSKTPVYRLYNANAGDHHYTMNPSEKNMLVAVGWQYEGIGWYSDDSKRVPLYRQYNPNAKAGSHNYTTDKGENDGLVRLGWRGEGIGWYAVQGGSLFPAMKYTLYFNNTASGTTEMSSVSSYSTLYAHFFVTGGDPDGSDSYHVIWTFNDGTAPYEADGSMELATGEGGYFSLYYTGLGTRPNRTVTANVYNSFNRLVAQKSVYWGV